MENGSNLSRPLLDRSEEATGIYNENSRGTDGYVGPRRDAVEAVSTVDVSVAVPRVNGRTAEVSSGLETQESVDELSDLLREQTEKDGKKDCKVSFQADVDVSGNTAQVVAAATHSATYALRQALKAQSTSTSWGEDDKEAAEKILHDEFHRNMQGVLSSPAMLSRKHSMALVGDFSSAQALLDGGVDAYVAAVNKLLRTELDESVTITFENMSLTARTPRITSNSGYTTVATKMFNLAFGCCYFTARAVRNALRGAPPIIYDETPILQNISGIIKPGRITLVLGPPGCGKTSFLKSISGKMYGSQSPSTHIEGDIRYNERAVKELQNLAAWVSYTGQDDKHQALLTVRETLNFAFKCRKEAFFNDSETLEHIRMCSGEAAVNRLKALKDIEVDVALALLGLSGCADTIIGNENLKGVSGGERRRVTLGEMMVTGSQILCCDEISTGLDSAATFDITAYLRSAAHALQKSVVVALLQPPPEVIDLFDDIILLAEGKMLYHGPREDILAYFNRLGFKLPDGKDLGDFIVEIPTRNGEQYMMNQDELEANNITQPPPKTVDELAERWEQSKEFAAEMQEVHAEKSNIRPKLFDHDKMPERGWFRCMYDTFSWCMTLRLRDRIQIIARIVANVVVGAFFGSLFWQLTIDDWWLKAMLFLMALMFLVSTSFPTVQIISSQRPIFYKHVEAKFYSASQFTLAQFLTSVPFVAFDVAVFGSSMYWMCGLAPHADAFLVFLAVCITFGVSMNTIMTMFPFITPDENTGIVSAALYLILSVVASGALSTESMIPLAFRWMMWINPLAWSYRALAINEYHTPEYNHNPCSFEIVGIKITLFVNCSDYFLSVREVRSDDFYVPGAVAVNCIACCLFLAIMCYGLSRVRFETKKVGATPKQEDEKYKSADGTPKSKGNYQFEKYLDAVSPRIGSSMYSMASATALPLGSLNGESDGEHRQMMTPGFRLNMVQTPPKTLLIKDLWYTIPINGEPIDFLKGVSFHAEPCKLTALMGSSGAGKTTLMDVISGRKTVGYSRGDILINGEPKIQHEFVKYTGYVEQFGIHADCATIKESLEFSANLRLPTGTTSEQIQTYVESMLELLELDDIQDALAGSLSMEQNKRLTLGVELVANPSIIFCDEPTSGLDARAAAIVMRVLWKVARSGRTVVCTIHQPSTVIFNFFDSLLLLKRGGEVVYFGDLGDHSKKMVDYFSSIPGVKPCPKGFNPATWMLEIIGAGTGADDRSDKPKTDFAQVYRNSEIKRLNDEELETKLLQFDSQVARDRSGSNFGGLRSPGIASSMASPFYHANTDPYKYEALDDTKDQRASGIYVRSEWAQFKILLYRNLQTYWRSPEFSLNRLLVVMIFTTIFACFFFRSQLRDVADIEGRIVNIFFFSSLTCVYNLYTLVPFALSRRALYYRERAQNMYSVAAFNWAEGLVEFPWICVQVITTVPLIYFMTNLNTLTWFPLAYFFACITLILWLMTSMGLFAASLFPDALAAQLAAVGALITLMVFCGIMVPKQNLPWPYLPMYYMSFFKYSSEGLMTTQFHDLDDAVCMPSGMPLEKDPWIIDEILKLIHKFRPDFPTHLPICSIDGNFDLLKPMASLKNLTGIQIAANKFVLDDFARDYEYDNRYIDLAVLLGWTLVLRLLTYIVMVFVNHQKR